MAGIQGLDEFEEFVDSMKEVSGQGRSDGIQKARRDALRQTAEDFQRILVEQIRATETAKGGTLDSRTSPYEPGGENESTGSNVHLSNKAAWSKTLVGNDTAVIFPNPDVHTRASWLEYGTSDHGPSGDTPMFFNVNGQTIVVTEGGNESPFDGEDAIAMAFSRAERDNNQTEPGEVSGVEPQGFFRRAVQVADELNIFKENMANELDKEFEEEGLVLEGSW